MTQLSLQFLGTFHVHRDGVAVTAFRSVKARALLAFLALEADRPHRRESLAAMFWPDRDEGTAKANLRQTLSRLRRALGDAGDDGGGHGDDGSAGRRLLEAQGQTLRFEHLSGVRLDARAFLETLAEVERHAHTDLAACPDCVERLEEAAALYRGELLEGLSVGESEPFEEWLLVERERFRQQALELLHDLTSLYERREEYGRAQTHARRQLALEPWHEAAHRQLIRLLALQGERAAALAQFEVCRSLLVRELGVEPSAATVDLATRIREGLPLRTGSAGVADAPPHNLLVPLTPLIGREGELEELTGRLGVSGYRLLTLVGPGGIGKTRLALEVARGQLTRFRDGVFFVPLAGVESAGALPAAVAQALGIVFDAPSRAPREQLLTALQEKEMLLVLDNFEHLLDGTDLVIEILRRASGLALLVTSRERLNVQAEDLYHLPGLSVPPEESVQGGPAASGSASVRLFLDRARRLDKAFRLDPATLLDVVRICRSVEGMPLAIELAATWIQQTSLRQVADATERGLDLLTTDLRDVAPRQRSLRAVFERSWELLAAEERTVFARLSVFRGGFGARAAAEVAGATPLHLTRLRYKTLVRVSGTGRYGVHELLRQFAEEKLIAREELASLRAKHSDHYLGALAQRGAALQGEAPNEAVRELQPDLDNLRLAWRWAVQEGRAAPLEASASALERLYAIMGFDAEGEEVFAETARRFADSEREEDRRICALALMELCRCQRVRGKYEPSLTTARKAVRLAEETAMTYVAAKALLAWGHSRLALGDAGEADALLARGLERARAGGHASVEAEILVNIGFVRDVQGDLAGFERALRDALAILRGTGDRSLEQAALLYLGLCQFERGDHDASRDTTERALELSAATGSVFYEASIVDLQGRIEQALGRVERALPLHERSLRLSREIGYRSQESHALHHLCAAHRKLGRLGRAEAFGREALAVAEAGVGPDTLSWAYLQLGYVALDRERWPEAQDAFERALEGWRTTGDAALAMQARAGWTEALLAAGQVEHAYRVAEPALEHLSEHGVAGTDEPSRVFLALYRALSACSDARAPDVLAQARAVIEARASRLADPALRRSYLEGIAENRTLVDLFRRAARA